MLHKGALIDTHPAVVALTGRTERRLVVRLRPHDAARDATGDVALDAPGDAVGVLARLGIAGCEVGDERGGIRVVGGQDEGRVAQGEETGAAGRDDIGPVRARDAHAQGASRQPAVRRRLQLDIDISLAVEEPGSDEERAARDEGRRAVLIDIAETHGEDRMRAGGGDVSA